MVSFSQGCLVTVGVQICVAEFQTVIFAIDGRSRILAANIEKSPNNFLQQKQITRKSLKILQ